MIDYKYHADQIYNMAKRLAGKTGYALAQDEPVLTPDEILSIGIAIYALESAVENTVDADETVRDPPWWEESGLVRVSTGKG